jgi:hypothetical protein
MASNSAVVMPLSRCCLEVIYQTEPPDRESEITGCIQCSKILVFHNKAWKDANVLNSQQWHDLCFDFH